MSVLDRKLVRDIARARGMLAAIAAIVAVGVGCLVGLQGVSRNLQAARDDYYRRCSMPDFWLDLKKAPATLLDELRRIPGVARLRGRIAQPVLVAPPGATRPVTGLVLSLPQAPEAALDGVVLTTGSAFTEDGRDQVLVSKDFADAWGIKPGDRLHLLLGGRDRTLTVTGSAISPEYVYLIPPGSIASDPENYGVFYVKDGYAEDELGFSGAVNGVVGLFTPQARSEAGTMLRVLESVAAPYGVYAATPLARQASNLTLDAELGGLATMAAVTPLLFLSVGALALNVLMARFTSQQRVVVGTLKALGYDDRAILVHFLKLGLATGLIGALAGCLLGWGIALGLTELYKGFFTFPALTNRFHPDVMAVSLLTGLLFGALGTLRGVRQVAAMSPAEAMRPPPPRQGGAIALERLPWLWERLGFAWQTTLRGIFRNKVRSLVGVFAAAVGSAILVASFGLNDSLVAMVSFRFDKELLADYTLHFRDPLDAGAVDEARRLPGVVTAEPLFTVAVTFEHGPSRHQGLVAGLTRGARLTVPRDEQGRPVAMPPEGLLMSRRLADMLHLGVGDSVRLVPSRGDRRPRSVQVAGFVASMFGLAVYADYGFLSALMGETGAVTSVRLRTDRTPALKREFLKVLTTVPVLAGLEDTARQRELVQASFVNKMGMLTYPLVGFAAVIFFGSILNASLIAIVERRREIATYRVLGYQPLQIGGLYLRENLVSNGAGLLLGLPLGKALLAGMAALYSNELYAMPAVIGGATWLWSAALTGLFVLCAQVFVQRAINRLDWREAINFKE